MKALLLSIMAAGLLLTFVALEVRAEGEPTTELSPLTPPVVREGDFAVKLGEMVGLGQVTDEVDAESLLTEIGLSPRKGWIADYPVTPVVLGELRAAMIDSSESGRLTITETDALENFDRLALELGLAIDQGSEQEYAEQPIGGPSPQQPAYGESPETENYYMAEGPPVMTYYPPPLPYYSYYDWVPCPFYFSGRHFSGFFIQHNPHMVQKLERHGMHDFSGSMRRPGRLDSRIPDRGFAGERQLPPNAGMRNGREALIGPSRPSQPGGARFSRSFQQGDQDSFRSFSDRDKAGGSFQSFDSPSRGISSPRGGGMGRW